MRVVLILAAVALVVAACGTGDSVAQADITGAWQLVSGVSDGTDLEPIDSHPVTIEIEAGRYGGTASCNGYGGEYSYEGNALSVAPPDITEMACMPDRVMALEQQFIAALPTIDRATIDGENLILAGPGTELVFESLPPIQTAELLNTVWVLDGLVAGDSVTSVSGDRATLEFFSDGSFIASTGCRSLTGSYVESAGGLSATELAASGKCPDQLREQDNVVVTVLEGTYRVSIEADMLTISIAGDQGLIYKAAS